MADFVRIALELPSVSEMSLGRAQQACNPSASMRRP
jgi:hypothetical protein